MPLRNVLLLVGRDVLDVYTSSTLYDYTVIEKVSSYIDKRLTDRRIQGSKDGQSEVDDDSEWHLAVNSLILD